MNPLDLFRGGRDKAVEAVRTAFVDALRACQPEFSLIENSLRLDKGLLSSIVNEGRSIPTDICRRLVGYLDLSLMRVLGQPQFDAESGSFWENQCEEKPMIVASCLGTGNREKAVVDKNLYVRLRAKRELYRLSAW